MDFNVYQQQAIKTDTAINAETEQISKFEIWYN
nr:MAG TPA: hypothetical protein [Caudoviricetes sp.]